MYFNHNFWVGGKTDWSKWETVWSNGDYKYSIDPILKYRTSSGKWISCWACRGRYKYAVSGCEGKKLSVYKNLECDPLMSLSWDVYFIDAEVHWRRRNFPFFDGFRYVEARRFESHESNLFKGHLDGSFAVVDEPIENFLNIIEHKSAHEAKRSSLERYKRRDFLFKLLRPV